MQKHGKNWLSIQQAIPNRTSAQIRTHAQKFFAKVSRSVPKGGSIIEFIKSHPVSYFVNIYHEGEGYSQPKDDLESPRKSLIPEQIEDNKISLEEQKKPLNSTMPILRPICVPPLHPFQSILREQAYVIKGTMNQLLSNLKSLYDSMTDDISSRKKEIEQSKEKTEKWKKVKEDVVRLQAWAKNISDLQTESIHMNGLILPQ